MCSISKHTQHKKTISTTNDHTFQSNTTVFGQKSDTCQTRSRQYIQYLTLRIISKKKKAKQMKKQVEILSEVDKKKANKKCI